MEAAAADYRRAIDLEPTLTLAYLRLGWIRVTLHDTRARESVEAGLAVASDPGDRYLARLLIGGIAERESRLDAALGDYEAARTTCPACQTPYIAIARVETARGNSPRAHETSRAFAALSQKADDPWWDFCLGGFDLSSLRWLRQAATPR